MLRLNVKVLLKVGMYYILGVFAWMFRLREGGRDMSCGVKGEVDEIPSSIYTQHGHVWKRIS